jgi:serine/threonine protein kinase/tetratricopeptide (TPR) repeat protein
MAGPADELYRDPWMRSDGAEGDDPHKEGDQSKSAPPPPEIAPVESKRRKPSAAMELTPRKLAEFEVVRRLGIGGMAEVFLAKKRGAQETYKLLVLKRILPEHVTSRRFRVMFAEEAQLATRLNHPNIVQVYDFQDYGEDGQLLSMEYVDGPDLRALGRAAIAKGKRIAPAVAAYIIAEVAKGLHYAHERKDERGEALDIVHRDVSPQNVLLSYDGAVKVADFGIASANLFREDTGVLKGKTGYMSPEQARAQKVDRRTDIYSLGVVLHELLTGRPLHGALEGDDLLEAVKKGRVEPPSTYALGIPPILDEIALKALSPNSQDRYATAREFSSALARAVFTMGKLVDSQSLETTIAELCGERTPEQLVDSSRESEVEEGSASELGTFDPQEGTPVEPLVAATEEGSEVRHVAVVSFELRGYEVLVERAGPEPALLALERLKSTLDAIAFKRNMLLGWTLVDGFPVRARAVAGLMANPTGAAADAMWFAVDLHEGVSGARDDLGAEFELAVGVVRSLASGRRNHSGHLISHVLAESAQELADLLRTKARPGTSLVAGGLYRLVRRDFLWQDAPNVEIDESVAPNLPPRMRVYELMRALSREEKLQEIALAPDELIGRDAEIADLHAAYYRAVGQAPGEATALARVVSGELGIGKTALVNAFVNELPPDAKVLRAECTQARRDVPYGVLTEWLRELTGTFQDQPLDEARNLVEVALNWTTEGETTEAVERLTELCTGRLGVAYDEAEVAHQSMLILMGLSQFVKRAAEAGPLVIVLDAMQWCDQMSLEVVGSLLQAERHLPVLVLLVARPAEHLTPYIEGLLRVELGGLSVESQARLLQVRLGVGSGVVSVCADVFPRASGNPYFLLEMVDALLERGVLEIREDGESGQVLERVDVAGSVVTLPTTLEQLIADRLTELSTSEQELLNWLAVAGAPVLVLDLAQLYGAEAEAILRRLSARGITELSEGKVDVKHPLTRDVAYRAMGTDQRRNLHRGLGELLASGSQSKGIQAAVVARHLSKGGKIEQAAELYLEAGGSARASYQIPLANRCYTKVSQLLPAGDIRLLEAFEALEAIARNEGRWKERRSHLLKMRRGAISSGNGYWVATALLRSAHYELDSGQLARAAKLASLSEQAAMESESEVVALQARSLLGELLRDIGDMQGALAAVDRALASANHPDITARLRAEVLRARGTLLRRVGRVIEALEAYAESIAVFQRVGARRMEARAKTSMAFAMYVLGRYEDGIALASQAMQIDSAIGGRFRIAKTLANTGLCYAGAGDRIQALNYLAQAREAHERYGERDSRADTLLATAEVLLEDGDIETATGYVGDAAALIQVTESRYDATHERLLQALLARARADAPATVARATEARRAAETQAYASFQFYAMALEAVGRVEIGEFHTGILLATTAFGAIEALQGSEYSLEIRMLCCEALEKAGSPQAKEIRTRSGKVARRMAEGLRNPELWKSFMKRRAVVALLGENPIMLPSGLSPLGIDL